MPGDFYAPPNTLVGCSAFLVGAATRRHLVGRTQEQTHEVSKTKKDDGTETNPCQKEYRV
jgi:hypothetical protein